MSCEIKLQTLVSLSGNTNTSLQNIDNHVSASKVYLLSSRNYLSSINADISQIRQAIVDDDKQLEVLNRILELLGGSRYE